MKPANIIIIDNSKTNQTFIKEWVKELPYVKVYFSSFNGPEFLAKFNPESEIDLILIDFHLPFYNGIELISHIPKTFHKKCILMSSGNPGSLDLLMRSGFGGFCQKSKELLLFAIKKLLNGDAFFDIDFLDKFKNNNLKSYKINDVFQDQISVKEMQIINYISCGLTYKEISEKIPNLSDRSIETYALNIRKKYELKNNSQLIKWASLNGYLYMYDDL